MTQETQESVLKEADPESLEELLTLDPLKMSDIQIETVVKEVRKARVIFEKEENEAALRGTKRRAKRNSQPKARQPKELSAKDKIATQLDLQQLGLNI